MNGHCYLKMMEVMINSVVLYGSEAWGCCTNLDQDRGGATTVESPIGYSIYGVDRRHLKASIMLETGVLPVALLAKIQYSCFWFQITSNSISGDRILKKAA